MVGSRCLTTSAALVLGSCTERLIRTTPVPLLAVRRKGENLGLVQALLDLQAP